MGPRTDDKRHGNWLDIGAPRPKLSVIYLVLSEGLPTAIGAEVGLTLAFPRNTEVDLTHGSRFDVGAPRRRFLATSLMMGPDIDGNWHGSSFDICAPRPRFPAVSLLLWASLPQ